MSKSILLIEDDEQMAEMLKIMLEKEGYHVMVASNGEEGIKLYRNNPMDLVITDIVMPEKEGIETIKELKVDYPDVKIIVMSGGGLVGAEEYLQIAKGFGVRHTIVKPFSREEILKAIRELI